MNGVANEENIRFESYFFAFINKKFLRMFDPNDEYQ